MMIFDEIQIPHKTEVPCGALLLQNHYFRIIIVELSLLTITVDRACTYLFEMIVCSYLLNVLFFLSYLLLRAHCCNHTEVGFFISYKRMTRQLCIVEIRKQNSLQANTQFNLINNCIYLLEIIATIGFHSLLCYFIVTNINSMLRHSSRYFRKKIIK